jgi:uncharacterized RDD family membrane protein YckC
MDSKYFSETGEWVCPRCGNKSTGPNCVDCQFCIYAGFWARVLASLVDKVLITGAAQLFLLVRTYSLAGFSLVTLAGFLFYRFYHIGCVALWGQTPGKMAAKIKIVKVDGSPAVLWNAFLRNSVETTLVTIVLVFELVAATKVMPAEYAAADLAQKKELIEAFIPKSASYVSWANQAFFLSEFVVLFLNKKKRAIHDFIAGTVVVHDPRLPFLPGEKKRLDALERP